MPGTRAGLMRTMTGVYELLVKREGISAASLGEVAGRLGLDMSWV